jgi:hypothetical protein
VVTVSVPPTVKPAVPLELVMPAAAEGVVVKLIELEPLVIDPPVVAMLNARVLSPVTVNASAELVEPGTTPTSPVTDPAPALVTITAPPVPVVKLPKLSVAVEVCVSTIGETTVAVAAPVAVEVLPEAAYAGAATDSAMTAQSRIFFMTKSPIIVTGSPSARYLCSCLLAEDRVVVVTGAADVPVLAGGLEGWPRIYT